MNQQPAKSSITRIGIDIGKSVFHVVGLDVAGKPVFRSQFTRERLIEFLARATPTVVGMEACPGSNWLARKAALYGHDPRIVPAQFVKPFVKSNKTDIVDAEAIAEAISRPTMRFAPPKTEAQLDLQALHRVRQRLISSKTAIINQARAFLLEYGLTISVGAAYFVRDMPSMLSDKQNGLTPSERLLQLRHQIESIASADDAATRLTSVPGIGQLTATAITAFAGACARACGHGACRDRHVLRAGDGDGLRLAHGDKRSRRGQRTLPRLILRRRHGWRRAAWPIVRSFRLGRMRCGRRRRARSCRFADLRAETARAAVTPRLRRRLW